jgi:molybdopterin-containing oxidoreductase family membrane subunit
MAWAAAGKRAPQMWAMYITYLRVLDRYRARGHADLGRPYLFRRGWRTSIYAAAEAMTVFAVMTAGCSR